MFDWLVEGWTSIYIVLGLALVLSGTGWVLTRDRRARTGFFVVLGLLVLYSVVDVLVETEHEAVARQLKNDRKQLQEKTEVIADHMNAKDFDKLFANVSEDFRFGGLDKKSMRRQGEAATGRYAMRDVKIWDIEIVEVDRPNKKAMVHFNIKAKTNATNGQYLLCKCEWVLDADGEWRIKTFQLYNPVVDQNQPLDIGLR